MKERIIESGKLTFALLGVGSTLANLSEMHITIMTFGAALVSVTWYCIYRVMQ